MDEMTAMPRIVHQVACISAHEMTGGEIDIEMTTMIVMTGVDPIEAAVLMYQDSLHLKWWSHRTWAAEGHERM